MKIKATALSFCLDMVSLPIFLPVLGTDQTETVAASRKMSTMIQLPFPGQGPARHQCECECMLVRGSMVAHGDMCACLSVTYIYIHLCCPQPC